MPAAEELGSVLYLDGIQVPFVGASVSGGINKIPTASIDLIPTDIARKILPGTRAHIFVRDFFDQKYRLFFEGEIYTRGFAKNVNARAMTVGAAAYSAYLTEAKKYYLDYANLGGGVTSLQRSIVNSEGKLAIVDSQGILSDKSDVIKFLREEGDFVKAVVALINATGKAYPIYNDAQNRHKIDKRILSATTSEIGKLLELSRAYGFIQQAVGDVSGAASVLDIVNRILDIIAHEVVFLPNPSYVGGKLGEILIIPQINFTPPPFCNVIFPDDYMQFNFNQTLKDLTRTKYQQFMASKAAALGMTQTESGQSMMDMAPILYVPSELNDKVANTTGKLDCSQDCLTIEERLKGVQSQFLPPKERYSLLMQTGALNNYTQKIVAYEHFLRKFSMRTCTINCRYLPYLAPGFPVLIMDDSDASQHVLGLLNSAQWSINASSGAQTTVEIVLPRIPDEIDFNSMDLSTLGSAWDGKNLKGKRYDEPPIPPWFEKSWGEFKEGDPGYNVFPSIDQNYTSLLGGDKGYLGGYSITSHAKEANVNGGISYLVKAYREAKKNTRNIHRWIYSMTRRRIPTIKETFNFAGAYSSKEDGPVYTGGEGSLFDGADENDRNVVELRRKVIRSYAAEISGKRGFRG